ncbi:hypothetical protein JTE90_001165 [Oedothorax gibbosus]|uniref:Uncharacterized protein n=1 Tax=Oedothorax gibbosus TaxID=931172 RepID=A0AAV6VGX7_9ARAC|nr:hypothetical protein JTE90_001165 [Oedothorax gibbosus]
MRWRREHEFPPSRLARTKPTIQTTTKRSWFFEQGATDPDTGPGTMVKQGVISWSMKYAHTSLTKSLGHHHNAQFAGCLESLRTQKHK